MGKLTKNQKLAAEKIEAGKAYSLKEAAQLVKEITYTKFDASLDIDVRLGVDPRKANQMVRGVVSLPHGTGKVVRVLVLCTPDAEAAAKEAGADYVGLDEYIEKIKGGWTDIDVIIIENGLFERFLINWPPLPRPTTMLRTLRCRCCCRCSHVRPCTGRSDDRDATAPSSYIIKLYIKKLYIKKLYIKKLYIIKLYSNNTYDCTYVRFRRGRRVVSAGGNFSH